MMNKRIQELAQGNERILDFFQTGPVQRAAIEDFAEAIVRECAKVSEDDITDGDACCTNTAYRIAGQIKKHFGVE